MGLGNVTVSLSGMADGQTTTDDSGQYSFTGLRSGTYSVEISGFDTNEVSFSSTSGAATVGVGESKVVSFDGTYLRTAGIMGQVSVDGEGLQGVTVTLMGEGEDVTDMTDAGGLYSFAKLKSGTYQVAISGYDTDDYEFSTTSKTATIATGETANVPFEGTLLRTAGIGGRVGVEGMGLDGVTVTLAGAAEATTETSNGGQYGFAGLAAGTYVLSITNPDANAYNFAEDEMMKTVVLEDDKTAIVNFSGTHTRTAMISGVLFIDEVDQNKMHDDGEPSITEAIAPLVAAGALDAEVVAGLLAKATVKLRGPDLADEMDIAINADGTFSTGAALMAGSYQVELPVNDDTVAAGLAAAGVAFVGESMVVTVEAGAAETANFPFRITMQTVATGARMGAGKYLGVPVAGVELALYARADGTGMLGEATTDEMGMASFTFARADNTGPAGDDNIVFVKAVDPGHEALVISGNEFVEIAYASTARLYAADADKEVATLVNVMASFDFWVKSNETARDGDEGLEGWVILAASIAEDGTATGLAPEMWPDPSDEDGKSSFSMMVDPMMLPATFAVAVGRDDEFACYRTRTGQLASDQPDQCEMWVQSPPLTHTHTGLDLPPGEDDDPTDLGPIRITYTTQAVYVGAHRELDDRTGFTDHIGLGDGDARPSGTAVGEIEVSLMVADERGRLRVLEYDHDLDGGAKTEDIEATAAFGPSGMVSFHHIPADTEITVVANAPNNMTIVPEGRSTTEIDAYGSQLDYYPDGKMVGAFGERDGTMGVGSGARADVWICPLWRQNNEDPNANCSTFAYKWASGTVTGSIGALRAGDKAEVILEPVNSNDDYASDLTDDVTVTARTGGANTFTFSGVADGRYQVILAANPGSWPGDTVSVGGVMHDEDEDDEDYVGETVVVTGLEATDLRGVIRGRIANDSNARTGITGDESIAGVEVAIHYAGRRITRGANAGRYPLGRAVVDADGDPVVAETDEDGVFMFEGLAVGYPYYLLPQGTDLYTAVRNGNARYVPNDEATDVVSHAFTVAALPPPPGTEPAVPSWNAHTSTLLGAGANDFALLYKNGEVEGEVSDPSIRAAHSRSVVELHLCKTTNYAAGPPVVPATQCSEYTGDVAEAAVDARGDWSADGLREGVYEVIVDLPAGYDHVREDGGLTSESTANATDGSNTLFTQQMVTLAGGRADASTETFHIKDRNAGDGVAVTTFLVDRVACDPGAAATHAANQCGHNEVDDGTILVGIAASTGAVIRLSSSAVDPAPRTTGSYSFALTNNRNVAVALPNPAGTSKFYLHIAAEDGYATNDPAAAAFNVRRDADIRVKDVTISWSGDRVELDRDALNLDPDGETDPVTGTTTLRVTVSEGDNDGTIPITALTVAASSMTRGFGVVEWADYDLSDNAAACNASTSFASSGNDITLVANTQTVTGRDAVCFRITDSDGDPGGTSNPDANPNNNRIYLLIVTRGS